MNLSTIGEHALLEKVLPSFMHYPKEVVLGIGDDSAVLETIGENHLLVTTDTLVEGVHFLLDKHPAFDLGIKALCTNLSDIAAMGGSAKYFLLNLTVPHDTDIQWVEAFFSGIEFLAKEEGVFLIGGDVSSTSHAITISITVIGECLPERVKRRNGVEVGDRICVTGYLGTSRAGLQLVQDGNRHEDTLEVCNAYLKPKPATKEGKYLGTWQGVHAMMDISDGLSSDIERLQKINQVGFTVYLYKLPIHHKVQQIA